MRDPDLEGIIILYTATPVSRPAPLVGDRDDNDVRLSAAVDECEGEALQNQSAGLLRTRTAEFGLDLKQAHRTFGLLGELIPKPRYL